MIGSAGVVGVFGVPVRRAPRFVRCLLRAGYVAFGGGIGCCTEGGVEVGVQPAVYLVTLLSLEGAAGFVVERRGLI